MDVQTLLELKEVWRELQDAAAVMREYTGFEHQVANPNVRRKLPNVLGAEEVRLVLDAAANLKRRTGLAFFFRNAMEGPACGDVKVLQGESSRPCGNTELEVCQTARCIGLRRFSGSGRV